MPSDLAFSETTLGTGTQYNEYVETDSSRSRVEMSVSPATSRTVALEVQLILARDQITRLEAARFQALADWWHEATDAIGPPRYKREHPAYQRIIALGDEAVPHILNDIRERGGDWHHALNLITGADPISEDAYGDAERIRELWLEWGLKHRW